MLEAARERPVRERGIGADDLEEGVVAEPGDRAARAEILMAARGRGAYTRPRAADDRGQPAVSSSARAYPDVSAIAPPGRLA
jgi:hypothetical protein